MVLAAPVYLQICMAQWRPSYQPTSVTYSITNDTFILFLAYSNWQGYFNNTYTIPAGAQANRLLMTFQAGIPLIIPKESVLEVFCVTSQALHQGTQTLGAESECALCSAGHDVLDETRNITWHMSNDLTFTLGPLSVGDVDRTGAMLPQIFCFTSR